MSTQYHRLTVTELASSDDIAVLRVSGELDHPPRSSSSAPSVPASTPGIAPWCWT